MVKAATYITTSWDDGHPLDLRLAGLLAKYGLPGTFYVPKTAENSTMTAAQVRELSCGFELGGHTLHHVELTKAGPQQAWQEITGSKTWIEDVTGSACAIFAPPKGRYSRRHLHLIRQAGYASMRTVELVSIDFPRAARQAGLMLMPTTVQAHPHKLLAYARNMLRRAAFRNLWLYLLHGRGADWLTLARSLLGQALRHGGVFHLWGHSWEIEKAGQWQRVEDALRFLSEVAGEAPPRTNSQICQAASPTMVTSPSTREQTGLETAGIDGGTQS